MRMRWDSNNLTCDSDYINAMFNRTTWIALWSIIASLSFGLGLLAGTIVFTAPGLIGR